jgi:DNA-directed RNA polymerase specialized sigma24 family protein
MGSEMGVPLAGTRLSLCPLPVKQEKEHTAQAQIKHVSKHQLAFDDLRFRVGSTEVAGDLVSQVFERALRHLADLQSTAAAGAWLFRIARNCATDYFRLSVRLYK